VRMFDFAVTCDRYDGQRAVPPGPGITVAEGLRLR
jgi:hypothetical protein